MKEPEDWGGMPDMDDYFIWLAENACNDEGMNK